MQAIKVVSGLLCSLFTTLAITCGLADLLSSLTDREVIGGLGAACSGLALLFLCLFLAAWHADGDGGLPA